MKKVIQLVGIPFMLVTTLSAASVAIQPRQTVTPIPKSPSLEIRAANVSYLADLDLLVFELKVKGTVGKKLPTPKGKLDGAPVLGYVFPTTLKPEDVGFSPTEGIVALAVTSHPDFDDSPL